MSINPLSIVQPDPIFVPSPIKRPPICGVKYVSFLLGIKPKPILPKTVLWDTLTFLLKVEHSIKTPEPIKQSFPILQFFEIVTRSDMYELSSIITPSQIIL